VQQQRSVHTIYKKTPNLCTGGRRCLGHCGLFLRRRYRRPPSTAASDFTFSFAFLVGEFSLAVLFPTLMGLQLPTRPGASQIGYFGDCITLFTPAFLATYWRGTKPSAYTDLGWVPWSDRDYGAVWLFITARPRMEHASGGRGRRVCQGAIACDGLPQRRANSLVVVDKVLGIHPRTFFRTLRQHLVPRTCLKQQVELECHGFFFGLQVLHVHAGAAASTSTIVLFCFVIRALLFYS
jgi:hypothetical protein